MPAKSSLRLMLVNKNKQQTNENLRIELDPLKTPRAKRNGNLKWTISGFVNTCGKHRVIYVVVLTCFQSLIVFFF